MIRLASLVALTLTMGGCLQGVGDRCQVTGDCKNNLVCVLPAGATAVTGGTCQKQATADGGPIIANDLQEGPVDQAAGQPDLAVID